MTAEAIFWLVMGVLWGSTLLYFGMREVRRRRLAKQTTTVKHLSSGFDYETFLVVIAERVRLHQMKLERELRAAIFGYREEEAVARLHSDLRLECLQDIKARIELRVVAAGPPVTAEDYDLVAECIRKQQNRVPRGRPNDGE